jgi:hypothetical protein
METCVVTNVHIPYNTKVVLIPMVQVRELYMSTDCLYTHGAHCYFQPALLPIFGRTDDDRTFEPDIEENEAHCEEYVQLTGHECLEDLTDWIVQTGTLPERLGRKDVIGDHFNYALVLRSVWDKLASDDRLDKHSKLDVMLRNYAMTREFELSDERDERLGLSKLSLEERGARYERHFDVIASIYAGLNANAVRFYGHSILGHRELLLANDRVRLWMNAYGKLLIRSHPGLEDHKGEYLNLVQSTYDSVKSKYY